MPIAIGKGAHGMLAENRQHTLLPSRLDSGANLITIACFHTEFQWWSGNLGAGTGGSEEAVVEMAQCLADLGWRVRVFNNCGEISRWIGGVEYIPTSEYRLSTPSDITIAWRIPRLFDHHVNSRKAFLWLQDVVCSRELTAARLQNLTAVLALSQFQRTLWPDVPENKICLTANGIDMTALDAARRTFNSRARNTMKCIYTSAPDRGLECLLTIWPAVRRLVPDAELFVYYGWDVWNFIHARDPEKQRWRDRILLLLRQPGVMTSYEHLTPAELWREYLTSAVWAYPTEWHETSCISAMKAQACGALPVTTNVAALDETVRWGTKFTVSNIYTNRRAQQLFISQIVDYLLAPDETYRHEMSCWANEHFSWKRIAEQWDREFRK